MKNQSVSYCSTAKDLSTAMSSDTDVIYIEGDLKKHVIRIKAIGGVAWAVCAAAIAVAVVCYLNAPVAVVAAPPAGGAALVAGITLSGAAATVLGPAAETAITVAVAAGGVGVLNTLRDQYKIENDGMNHLKLVRKH